MKNKHITFVDKFWKPCFVLCLILSTILITTYAQDALAQGTRVRKIQRLQNLSPTQRETLRQRIRKNPALAKERILEVLNNIQTVSEKRKIRVQKSRLPESNKQEIIAHFDQGIAWLSVKIDFIEGLNMEDIETEEARTELRQQLRETIKEVMTFVQNHKIQAAKLWTKAQAIGQDEKTKKLDIWLQEKIEKLQPLAESNSEIQTAIDDIEIDIAVLQEVGAEVKILYDEIQNTEYTGREGVQSIREKYKEGKKMFREARQKFRTDLTEFRDAIESARK